MLYCLVLGEAIRNTFLVTINEKTEVPELRETIRKKKEYYFNDLKADADQLILWKVEINAENMDLNTTICANDVKKGEELDPFKGVYVYFNKSEHLSKEKPSSRIINIIVQPSPPATTGKCLPMVYLSNKKFALSHIFFIRLGKEKRSREDSDEGYMNQAKKGKLMQLGQQGISIDVGLF